MFEKVLNKLLIYSSDPPIMSIKHQNEIRYDRLCDRLDVIDAAIADSGKLPKATDLISLTIDIDLFKPSNNLKLHLNKLSNLISHELVMGADYDIRIVSVSYSIKALGKKSRCR